MNITHQSIAIPSANSLPPVGLDLSKMTILSGLTPLAHGAVRDIWDRPDHPDQILKTIRAHKRAKYENRGKLRRTIDHLRYGPYGTFQIEYMCYLNTAYNCMRQNIAMPIAEIGGLILTDFGLAQVGEKISDTTGNLAQTLATILDQGTMTPERLVWLNEFTHNLIKINANVPDLRPVNVVIDERQKRFVLIDGYGDKTLLPVRSWFRTLNQKNLTAQLAKIANHGNLEWHAETHSFSLRNP